MQAYRDLELWNFALDHELCEYAVPKFFLERIDQSIQDIHISQSRGYHLREFAVYADEVLRYSYAEYHKFCNTFDQLKGQLSLNRESLNDS